MLLDLYWIPTTGICINAALILNNLKAFKKNETTLFMLLLYYFQNMYLSKIGKVFSLSLGYHI